MTRIRLRTKLILSLIFTTALLSGASLLVVQNYLRNNAKERIFDEIPASLLLFQEHEEQRQKLLLQSGTFLADLPKTQAVMTITDELTIQDSSAEVWVLSDWDLFILADRTGKVKAFHSSTNTFRREAATAPLARTLSQEQPRDWWFEGDKLYEVYRQPVYLGPSSNDSLLGFLITGYAIDDRFAATARRITLSEVAVRYGQSVVASSLDLKKQRELSTQEYRPSGVLKLTTQEVRLGDENFVAGSIPLAPVGNPPVTLTVLRSFDEATRFLTDVNQLLVGVGLVALAAGAALMFLIAHTFMRPLAKLSSGVAALEKGDFSYPLPPQSRDEIGELLVAFDTMRRNLKESQRNLVHAERLATIGRMASTVSHDLRHPLTTILAYAELLSESNLNDEQRADLYRQIRLSVNNMAELIASLLEFSKAQEALHRTYGDCVEALQDTVRTVKLRPEFDKIQLTLLHEGPTQGWFDFAKLDRVFHNLLKNACEAVPPDTGRIRVVAVGSNNLVEISVSDNGAGIPEEIRDDLFHPFVTFGKADGTGLGLAVVYKIVRDHGGDISVESTGSHGTTFKLTLPVLPSTYSPAVAANF